LTQDIVEGARSSAPSPDQAAFQKRPSSPTRVGPFDFNSPRVTRRGRPHADHMEWTKAAYCTIADCVTAWLGQRKSRSRASSTTCLPDRTSVISGGCGAVWISYRCREESGFALNSFYAELRSLTNGLPLPDQCLQSTEADVRPPRRKSGFGPNPGLDVDLSRCTVNLVGAYLAWLAHSDCLASRA
jgi:hypothetical protein